MCDDILPMPPDGDIPPLGISCLCEQFRWTYGSEGYLEIFKVHPIWIIRSNDENNVLFTGIFMENSEEGCNFQLKRFDSLLSHQEIKNYISRYINLI